jgi:hypothetical protein
MYRSLVEVVSSNPHMVKGHGYSRLQYEKDDKIFDVRLGKPGLLLCRIDLNFIRVGKDAPAPLVGGKAIDRVGVLFCDPTPHLKAGHVIRCIKGPVTGTFIIKNTPDPAIDFFGIHHLEVFLTETSQALNNVYPEQEPQPYVEGN